MRIADKMQYEAVKSNLGKNRTQMAELQNQAATQKRVTKPSDDPLAASRVLFTRSDYQSNRQFNKNLGYAHSFLEFTDQSLSELSDILVRAKELAISQSSDASANERSRQAVATELGQLYNQMISIGNRKIGDRFLFGGFNTINTPFDDTGKYAGDDGQMMIHIDKETFLPMNVPGGRVFLGRGVDADGLVHEAAPQPKTIEELEVQLHQENSPVKASVTQNSTGNEWVRSPTGEFAAGTDKSAMPDANAAPQTATASASGTSPAAVTTANGKPAAPITEPVAPKEIAGGVNLFTVVRALGISLAANDKAGVQDSLEVLDKGLNQVVLARSQVGSRGMILDSYMVTNEKQKVDDKIAVSQLEDSDVFSTVSDINKAQSTLQATLEASGKMIQPSLLSFLR